MAYVAVPLPFPASPSAVAQRNPGADLLGDFLPMFEGMEIGDRKVHMGEGIARAIRPRTQSTDSPMVVGVVRAVRQRTQSVDSPMWAPSRALGNVQNNGFWM